MNKIIDVDGSFYEVNYHAAPLCAKLLAAAGFDREKTEDLLSADNSLMTSRSECVRRCVELLMEAKKNGTKVFIGGDYDADGICSTAIMKDILDRLQIPCGYYIPNRFSEGYGLRSETVEMVKGKGYGLIVTVDNGVSAREALAKCRELCLPVIVTDHHRIEGEVDCDLLVHPDLMEEDFAYLCGAGVVLQISRTLFGDVPLHTALAAVAHVGDVMPLYRQTRRIVARGMELINQDVLPPVSALLSKGGSANIRTLAFQIVPKLNSVGRMNDLSNVNTLVPYLLMKDQDQIMRFALQLENVNNARKDLSTVMTKKCEEMIDDSPLPVLYSPEFSEGICGLAAGRLAAACRRPVLVLSGSGDTVKGSGRSVPGFDLFEFFSDFEELTSFGGHEQAVGLSLAASDLERFRAHVRQKMDETGYIYREEEITAIRIPSDSVTIENITSLEQLQPLPRELSDILFAVDDLVLRDTFRTAKVTRYRFLNQSGGFDGILFAPRPESEPEPSRIIGRLSLNRWKSAVIPQVEIVDLK